MQKGFTRGLVIGSIIGASVTMMRESGRMGGRNRRRMMRSGKRLLSQSGQLISDVVDIFR